MVTHPRLSLNPHEPAESAAALGYRMPGEFEPIDAVWLTYPHNRETWPGNFDRACEQYDFFMSQVARFANVELTGEKHGWPTNDSWIRDYGPIFVTDATGGLGCHDFHFNGWGGKYNAEYHDDDLIPQRVAAALDLPIWIHDLVLEGGSIEVNGRGTVMTTAQCLLNDNRNPHLDRAAIEAELGAALGVDHVIWLPGGILGDDTDGHIDDIARFIAPNAVAAVKPDDPSHPDHDMLQRNWAALASAVDQDGQPLELIPLPAPEPIQYDFPPDRFGPGGRHPVPASYANFLIVNEAVLVPTFAQPSDEVALRRLDDAMPAHTVIGVPGDQLVVGLGALHCLSQQQPIAR